MSPTPPLSLYYWTSSKEFENAQGVLTATRNYEPRRSEPYFELAYCQRICSGSFGFHAGLSFLPHLSTFTCPSLLLSFAICKNSYTFKLVVALQSLHCCLCSSNAAVCGVWLHSSFLSQLYNKKYSPSLPLALPLVNMLLFQKVTLLFDSKFIKSKRRRCNRLGERFEEIAIGIRLYLADPENSRFLSVIDCFFCAICSY